METTYAKWLRAAMNSAGMNQHDLSRKSRVPQPTIQRILKGTTKNPRGDTIKALATALGAYYEPSMRDGLVHIAEEPPPEYIGSPDSVPVISWVQAGSLSTVCDPYPPGMSDDWKPCPVPHGPHTFALIVRGDSMTSPHAGGRSYPPGTIIYVDPEKRLENGDRIVAKVGEEATFKVYSEDAGSVFLRPLNPQFPTIEVNGDWDLVGVVIASLHPE